jgi:hypothetical protein
MRTLILFTILLFSLKSFAGFYIEPGVTLEKGDSTLDWPSPFSSSTGTTQGLGLDLKLGFNLESILFAGVEGTYSKPQFKNSANNYDAPATSQMFGILIGAQMPVVGLRVWGGYIFDGFLDPEEDQGIDVKFTGATGPKLGLGFKLFLVGLNLEYADLSYKTSTLEQPGMLSGPLDSQFKNKLWLASVSLPLTF